MRFIFLIFLLLKVMIIISHNICENTIAVNKITEIAAKQTKEKEWLKMET